MTNDSLAPLRAFTGRGGPRGVRRDHRPRSRPRPGRLNRIGPPAGAGRWSLVAPLREPAPTPTESAHATALQLVERHGVVTREAVLAEGVVGGYSSVYGVLKVLEERGQVRRGYFVSGLGAAQFALPGAVDRLRLARERADDAIGDAGVVAAPLVLAATDPAQPYGATLTWPDSAGRPARSANALVVLRDGVSIAWYDRRSHHLVTFPRTLDDRTWAEALADLVRAGRLRKVEVRKVDGEPLATSPARRRDHRRRQGRRLHRRLPRPDLPHALSRLAPSEDSAHSAVSRAAAPRARRGPTLDLTTPARCGRGPKRSLTRLRRSTSCLTRVERRAGRPRRGR